MRTCDTRELINLRGAINMKLRVMALGLALCLAACGGNGGSGNGRTSGGPVPTTPAPALTLTQVVTGLTNPLGMESARDNSGRMFAVEQAGRIKVVQNGVVLGTFLDISALVTSGGETGLLGLAFHPSYTTNRKFYLNYTRTSAGQLQNVIVEYQASAANPNIADTSTARILLTYDQPFTNHNGGQLAFGPDGFLYIGVGDGGGGGDPQGNGQNTNALLGKILRIDVNSTSAGKQYAIPSTNPFANGAGGLPEIFAWGFRNPWRFSFDSTPSRMYVADVGQDAFEEIDLVEAGKNYGWNTMEGTHCFSPSTNCTQAGLTLPILDYSHSEGESVTGGFVYRGTAIPALVGYYIAGDFISGRIWTVAENGTGGTWAKSLAISTGRNVSAFGQDQNGDLYVVDYAGSILKIVAQ